MLSSPASGRRQLVLNVLQGLALGLDDDRQGEVDAAETADGEDGVVQVDAAGPLADEEVHLVAEEGGEGDEGGGEA